MFLSVLYAIFAVLLFVSHASYEQDDEPHRFDKPLVDQPGYITMEARSDLAE